MKIHSIVLENNKDIVVMNTKVFTKDLCETVGDFNDQITCKFEIPKNTHEKFCELMGYEFTEEQIFDCRTK